MLRRATAGAVLGFAALALFGASHASADHPQEDDKRHAVPHAQPTQSPPVTAAACKPHEHLSSSRCCAPGEDWAAGRGCACADPLVCGPPIGSPFAPPGTHTCQQSDAADCISQCTAGNAESCTMLGYLYDQGEGVPKSLETAFKFFRIGCEKQSAVGCGDLGGAYEKGYATPPDAARAVALYRRSCRGGSMVHCANLAYHLEMGTGIAPDPMESVALYKRACDANQAHACNNLGVKYDTGSVLAVDKPRAAALYQKACDLGQGHACGNLGILYCRGGVGVPQDRARGRELAKKGCAAGNQSACSEQVACVDAPQP